MKLDSLYEYIVLTHYLNFTTAAANLHTSQPNLSKHILELEQELGVELLKRGKRLQLTAAGTAFLEDAIQIHHLYKDAVRRTREIATHEIVELVIQEPYIMDSMSEILFKTVVRFKRENPYVMTKYFSEKGKKSVELLEQGKIDVALTVDCNSIDWIRQVSEKKNLIFYPVVQERLHVWMWEDHPLASRERITLEDLLHVPINMTATRSFDPMRFAVLDLFQKELNARPNLQTFSNESLNEFFMNTQDRRAVFLVSPAVANSHLLKMQQDMVSRPIDDERAVITSYLLFRSDYQKEAIDHLLDTLEKVVNHEMARDPQSKYLEEIAVGL
ncbi:MAG: LysR family transcriptional regulator [Eggerthellaceae bacterium]|nr:LysR family transcriptional regulator [Eggerthellaceae bacterium]